MVGEKILTSVILFALLNGTLSNIQDSNGTQNNPLDEHEPSSDGIESEAESSQPTAYEHSETGLRTNRRSDNASATGDGGPANVERPGARLAPNRTKGVADMVHRFFAEKAREDAYQTTEAQDHPYSLSYLLLNKKGQPTSICSGTLVTTRWVVTAAHCLMDQPVHSVEVFAGVAYNILQTSRKPPKSSQVRVSYEFFAHPRYDPDADDTDWDVALIKIDPPFRSTRFVRPVPMTSTPWDYAGYRTCHLTAFGKVRDQMASPDDYIRKTQTLQVRKPCACRSYLEEKMGIDPVSRYICMLPKADFGTCAGDSGGGLVCDGELKAVVSFSLPIEDFSKCRLRGPSGSSECGDVDMFDIWQDLYPSLGWIKKNAFQVNGTVESTTEGTASGMLGLSMPLSVIVFGLISLA